MANRRRGPNRIRLPRSVKERWFRRGSAALAKESPNDAGKGYACPLCLRASTSVEAFSVEDIPPRRVGGRPYALTCHQCNSRAGHDLDFHWGHLSDLEAFGFRELSEPLQAELSIGAARTSIDLRADQAGLGFTVIERKDNPRHATAVEQQQKLLLASTLHDTTARISFTHSRCSLDRAALSILKSAYLLAFATLGYRFRAQL